MGKESEAATQIQKYICATYINRTFSSTELNKNGKNITNSFQTYLTYLKTNENIQTLSKNTKITHDITAQFKTKKEKEEAKLMSISSMLGYALEDFCHALEDSGCLLCIASATALTRFLDNRNNNTRINQHISILTNLKNIWLQNLTNCYPQLK